MKFVHLFAAAALAVAPSIAMAQTTSEPSDGGTAAGPLPIIESTGIPAGAIVVGGMVILAGIVIGIVAATDDDGNAAVATATSTGGS